MNICSNAPRMNSNAMLVYIFLLIRILNIQHFIVEKNDQQRHSMGTNKAKKGMIKYFFVTTKLLSDIMYKRNRRSAIKRILSVVK